jgi:hypothetical protein
MVSVIDFDEFKVFDEWSIQVELNRRATSVLDDNFMYLPVAGGQILVIDKFSGNVSKMIDVGAMEIVDGLVLQGDTIYCACAVPIRFKNKLMLNNYCVLHIDKNTGSKVFQSGILSGEFLGITVDGGYVYSINSPWLYRINSKGDIDQNKLTVGNYFSPVVSDDYIACFSKAGTVEVFTKDTFSFRSRLLIKESTAAPLFVGGNNVFWAVNGSLRKIDLSLNSFDSVIEEHVTGPVVHSSKGYLMKTKDRLTLGNAKTLSRLDFKDPLDGGISFRDFFIIYSNNNILQIEA